MSMLWLLLHRDPVASDRQREEAVSVHEPHDPAEMDARATDMARAGFGIHACGLHRKASPDSTGR